LLRFRGLFSFKYEHIAETMAKSRLHQFLALNVDTLIINDPGCLMHLRQEAKDLQIELTIIHLANFLSQVLNLGK